MEIINPISHQELPLQLNISFKKVYDSYLKYTADSYRHHPFHEAAKLVVEELKDFPELIEGFSDVSLLEKHKDKVNLLLEPLFPEPLLNNEIKAASVPFSFASFKFSTRFENILKNAGPNYELKVRNFEDESMYIMACTIILAYCYQFKIDMKRPFYFDIPDQNTGTTRYYRAAFNADFAEITKTDRAPQLTDEDFKELLDNFHNIDIWKEKFPPESYIFKGFGIINLFDVTAEEMVSAIKANLLAGDEALIDSLQGNLRDFYAIKDLRLGFSLFDKAHDNICISTKKKSHSLILKESVEMDCDAGFFCDGIMNRVFKKQKTFIISDVEKYGQLTNYNPFYQNLKKANLKSILLIPIEASNTGDLALLEIASPRAYDLNSVNINKLRDILPVFEAAVKRTSEEHQNILEATIQENYTSIHSSVKWRFYQAAQKYFESSTADANAQLDEIVFNDVYPLFAQSDIKGSSTARNEAIQKDLITQLTLAIEVLKAACKTEKLPIYEELMFRVSKYLEEVKDGLKAGDEISILDFLKRDIYPVFNHIRTLNDNLKEKVSIYKSRLNPELGVVYEHRKNYEETVTQINDKLARYLDAQQKAAQEMFPHYFERYKTDGVEFNMYIGQSITNEKTYNEVYLYNLRLWQLQVLYGMENIAFSERDHLVDDLRVASLILVHSNPMAIKFRMDEKQFDVDGAYNIRYEIIKKRIDKALIKGSNERLTVPGKIAVVYSQDKDAEEYLKYIKYMQSKNQLGKIEQLQLEDLQGVSGLKALRVEVIYSKDFESQKSITFDDLMQEIKA